MARVVSNAIKQYFVSRVWLTVRWSCRYLIEKLIKFWNFNSFFIQKNYFVASLGLEAFFRYHRKR